MVPNIGNEGVFTFKPPFNTLSLHNEVYTCQGLDTVSNLTQLGIDVYKSIYEPNGISNDDFKLDLKNETLIVTLVDSSNFRVRVPDSYIVGMGVMDGVIYRQLAIAISIGQIPINLELDLLLEELKKITFSLIGVDPEVKLAELSKNVLVSMDEHERLKKIKENRKTMNENSVLTVIRLENEKIELLEKIKLLERVILENCPQLVVET